jgi:hypothetical protein
MDHTTVVRTKMTERYLLAELDAEAREEFEEHFFDCQECALDVGAGAQFLADSKVVLAESSAPVPVPATPERGRHGWFAWLRPAFAAPALALLLVVAGYQNLVILPRLRSDASQPQVLPSASVNLGTYGAGGSPTVVPAGKGLLLFVRIPLDGSYARYTAELHSPGGKLEGSFSLAAIAGQDQCTVVLPSVPREAGTYTIAVQGITAAGESKDLGNKSFELQIQR